MLAPKSYKKEKTPAKHACKKLKQDNVDCIDAGAGVSEPGLNRWPDKENLHLRYGGGLKILWLRPSWVQVPPPAPLC